MVKQLCAGQQQTDEAHRDCNGGAPFQTLKDTPKSDPHRRSQARLDRLENLRLRGYRQFGQPQQETQRAENQKDQRYQ